MVGTHRDQLLQPLAHLFRRAVDARRVGPFWVIYTVVNQRWSSARATSGRSSTAMKTRFEVGKVAGSRPAISRASRRIGTDREKAAMLEPPDPIQPSASLAERRTALGWPTPIQIGIGCCTGLGDIGSLSRL